MQHSHASFIAERMNYRHAYHAGNFADVLKHVVLTRIIAHYKLKDAPFRVIDTHAGPGAYRLDRDEPLKTGEWRDGIGRILAQPPAAAVAAHFEAYFAAIGNLTAPSLELYPGSPLVALRMLRPGDSLIANELHASDVVLLRQTLAGAANAKVLNLDGWLVPKSTLPPKERRAIILVDPPFEQAGEFDRLVDALAEGLRRFATGTFMLWYPIKDETAVARFQASVRAIAEQLASGRWLIVSLDVAPNSPATALHATGLAVINPPFTLASQCRTIMPYLARVLGQNGPGKSLVKAAPACDQA